MLRKRAVLFFVHCMSNSVYRVVKDSSGLSKPSRSKLLDTNTEQPPNSRKKQLPASAPIAAVV